MLQQLCNEHGTLATVLDVINEASTESLTAIRSAILAGDRREVGRLVTLLYEDRTYIDYSDEVADALRRDAANERVLQAYYPQRIGFALGAQA